MFDFRTKTASDYNRMLLRPDHDVSMSERNEFSHDFELTLRFAALDTWRHLLRTN
jgi:hypothetical protein